MTSFVLAVLVVSAWLHAVAQADIGTCGGYSREDRDRIRSSMTNKFAAKGYSKRLEGYDYHEQSFNPTSFDKRFVWKKPEGELSFPWLTLKNEELTRVFGNLIAGLPVMLSSDGDETLVNQLGASEVILWLGCNPPYDHNDAPEYYGFNTYLSFWDTNTLKYPHAAVGDSLNQFNLNHTNTGGSNFIWGSASAILFTADQVSAEDMITALSEAGVPPQAISVQVVPSLMQNVNLGVGPGRNFFMTGARIAMWRESALRKAYMEYQEPIILLSAKHRSAPPQPYSTPPSTERRSEPTEQEKYKSLQEEMVAAAKAHAAKDGWHFVDEDDMTPLTVKVNGEDVYINGTKCIEDPAKSSFCFADTQDAAYFKVSAQGPVAFHLPFTCGQMAYVVGINHFASGYASYSSLAWQSFLGTSHAMNHEEYDNSALEIAPDVEGADKAFAVQLRQTCRKTSQTCLPLGFSPGQLASRAYLNPATFTGPDPHQLIPPRVIRFKYPWWFGGCYIGRWLETVGIVRPQTMTYFAFMLTTFALFCAVASCVTCRFRRGASARHVLSQLEASIFDMEQLHEDSRLFAE